MSLTTNMSPVVTNVIGVYYHYKFSFYDVLYNESPIRNIMNIILYIHVDRLN